MALEEVPQVLEMMSLKNAALKDWEIKEVLIGDVTLKKCSMKMRR